MAWIKRLATMKRYGVSRRTLERWEADPALGFPRSRIINGRKYDSEELLDNWDAACATAGRTTRTPPNAGRAPERAG
jgi:hypothetical protein